MYDKSVWLFEVHNLFKTKDGLTSEQSYRRIFDNIGEVDSSFEEGLSPPEVYDEYWE